MRSQIVNHFSTVPGPSVQRSVFDRSHSHKTTFYASNLIPVYVDEVLPGDTFNMKASMFIRKQSSIVPVMDNLYFDLHFFFVPCRLVWSNFKKFMGEQANPADSTSYTIPTVGSIGAAQAIGSLTDYFGLPTNLASAVGFAPNALPYRAYHLIWNEWYRDENLCNSVTVNTGDSDLIGNYALRSRMKSKDYFTSCLPWPQKNNTGSSVDFLVGAPVSGATGYPIFRTSGDSSDRALLARGGGSAEVDTGVVNAGATTQMYWKTTGLTLGASTVGTINALRQAFQIQKLYEKDARGGTRYTEIVRAHFGVISPDARLQRPEFLGSVTTRLNEHPVTQTSGTGASGTTTPLATLGSFATAASNGGFVASFTEHGYVMGICSSRAELTYQDGIHKMWTRSSRLDFYWPALANLGEQPVLNQEIQWLNDGNDTAVWGYNERWSEYRYKPSYITGKFRSRATGTLDIWHYAQDYKSGRISLNETFITQPYDPILRNLAVPSEPHFMADFWFDLKCVRPMPVYSIPGMVDRF